MRHWLLPICFVFPYWLGSNLFAFLLLMIPLFWKFLATTLVSFFAELSTVPFFSLDEVWEFPNCSREVVWVLQPVKKFCYRRILFVGQSLYFLLSWYLLVTCFGNPFRLHKTSNWSAVSVFCRFLHQLTIYIHLPYMGNFSPAYCCILANYIDSVTNPHI